MTQAEQVFSELNIAIMQASNEYKAYLNHLSIHTKVKNSPGWHKRFMDITETELPNNIGQLIVALNLHKEFQSLQHHVRNFEDAQFVLNHMREVIITKMKDPQIESPFNPINKLISLFRELSDIIVHLIGDPSIDKV
jgi:hypothetical protein